MFFDYPFQSSYFPTESGRLHYVDEGQGPVVVMVHGNPTWSYYYRHLITALKTRHRVIAVDHLGCGLSDKPTDFEYILENHIDNLHGLLAFLGVDSFSLVVHDWGGAIGIGAASKNYNRLEKIVVLNTAAFRSTSIPFRIGLCRLPVVGEVIVRLFNGFAWPATFMAVTNRLEREVVRAYLSPYDSWRNRIAIHRFVKDIPLSAEHRSYNRLVEIENSLAQLRDLQIPMQIIWGGSDFCFTTSFYDEWRERFPEAECHCFADGGHYILEDKRDQVIDLIGKFLTR